MDYQLIETPDDETFFVRSASFLAEAITLAIDDHGHCLLGLSGGKTPKGIYTRLAQEPNVEWGRVHLFLVDERCVPADHMDSNQHLLETTLLRYGLIDRAERCTFPNTSLDPEDCAEDYDRMLNALFGNKGPADILVMGIGEDGHTASLFPPVPMEAFEERYAIHTVTAHFAVHDRISMTVKPLHAARSQCFFLAGERKKKVWEEMVASEEGPERWPAKAIMAYGETTVIMRKGKKLLRN
jgi:6-phosphogluconolactonase